MPFILIQGTFHLVGKTQAGNPTGFEPDGDSIQFKPANPQLLDRLTQLARPYRLTSIGSTQLRLEDIDALELHFDRTHQPRPLADEARDFITGELGLNPVPYRPPTNLQVKPPVERAAPGYILSRSLEVNGRPVAFAFAGTPPQLDGTEVFLRAPQVEQSLNSRSLGAGHAYPLFYDTLFADLRQTLTQAAAAARQATLGLWQADRSDSGLAVAARATWSRTESSSPSCFAALATSSASSRPAWAGSCRGWPPPTSRSWT
jgi:endonuclease YncB( thermonuclease family)